MHHTVGLANHKHLIENCIMVNEALEDTWRLDVFQIFLAEDDGHLMGIGAMSYLGFTDKRKCDSMFVELLQSFKATFCLENHERR